MEMFKDAFPSGHAELLLIKSGADPRQHVRFNRVPGERVKLQGIIEAPLITLDGYKAYLVSVNGGWGSSLFFDAGDWCAKAIIISDFEGKHFGVSVADSHGNFNLAVYDRTPSIEIVSTLGYYGVNKKMWETITDYIRAHNK